MHIAGSCAVAHVAVRDSRRSERIAGRRPRARGARRTPDRASWSRSSRSRSASRRGWSPGASRCWASRSSSVSSRSGSRTMRSTRRATARRPHRQADRARRRVAAHRVGGGIRALVLALALSPRSAGHGAHAVALGVGVVVQRGAEVDRALGAAVHRELRAAALARDAVGRPSRAWRPAGRGSPVRPWASRST